MEAKRLAKEQEEALRKLAAQQAARASAQQRLIDDYKRRISDKIRRFVVLPPNLQGNPEAEFDVVQIPGGEVERETEAHQRKPAYDAAVERASTRRSRCRRPTDSRSANSGANLKFRPKEKSIARYNRAPCIRRQKTECSAPCC